MLRMVGQLVDTPSAYSGGGLPKGGIMIVISVALYILPTLLAWTHGTKRFGRIAFVNLALGWTIVGWIASVAMIYAGAGADDERAETDQ
jgi:hypothetical protein